MKDKIYAQHNHIPFGTYDFFGYLIPGLTFMSSIFFYEFYTLEILSRYKITNNNFHKPVYTISKLILSNDLTSNWILSLFSVLIIVCIIYTIGHVVASASSFFIDRVLIHKGYGYPYEFLLGIESKKEKYSVNFYRGLYFWINILLIVIYINFLFLNNNKTITCVFVILFIIPIIFKVAISGKKCKSKQCKLAKYTKKFFEKCYGSLYNALSALIANYLNTKRSFNDDFTQKYTEYFKDIFSLDPEKAESNNYWLSYCFVAENSSQLISPINNWLHLYAFARNISMSFYLAFLYSYISIVFQLQNINNFIIKVIIPSTFFILAIIMLIRYYYLYTIYYSKFIFRSFVFLNDLKKFQKNF